MDKTYSREDKLAFNRIRILLIKLGIQSATLNSMRHMYADVLNYFPSN